MNRIAPSQSSFHGHVVYSKFFGPLCHRFGLSFPGEHNGISSVSCLVYKGGPSHVSWKIPLRIINTIKCNIFGLALWFWNFFKKCSKIKPRLINSNSPASIIFIVSARWTSTSLNYVMMNSIQACCSAFSFVTMFVIHEPHVIHLEN